MTSLIGRSHTPTVAAILSLLGLIAVGGVTGCGGGGGGGGAASAMTENDFAADPSAVADPDEGIVVDFLEAADSALPDQDTGDVGVDIIPYEYRRATANRFCWQDDDVEAEHFATLIDRDGAEVLRIQANGECVTKVIEPGKYVLQIVHDGRSADTLPVFVEAGAGETAAVSDVGLLQTVARLLSTAAHAIGFVQPALAQPPATPTMRPPSTPTPGVAENVETLLRTRQCRGCRLDLVDLSHAMLDRVDLSNASLQRANLIGVNLHRATLHGVNFYRANLAMANLTEADIFFTALEGAILTEANFAGATVEQVGFRNARLTGANLSGLNLMDENFCLSVLDGANLTGADLSGANWVNCRPCLPGSIGMCIQEPR